MSFQDWCDWARNQPADSHWPYLAENADADAKYENAGDRDNFRQDLGNNHPQDHSTYRQICYDYPLKGEPVSGSPPEYLTRCKQIDSVRDYNRELLRQTADIDRRNHGNQYQSEELSISAWQHVGEAFGLAQEFWEDDFFVGYSNADPEESCVFATPQTNDNEPPSGNHVPEFYRTIQSNTGPDKTEADCAVYRLGLKKEKTKADSNEDWLLIYYRRTNIEETSCRYPVPPDAGDNPRFRPISSNANEPFGLTCPGDLGNCDDQPAEPELVHPSYPLAPTDVWVLPLDN